MANPDLMTLFYCIATLFFSYQIFRFIIELIIYCKDKSLGNNIYSREIIMSAWLLLPFIIAYGLTILLVKSFKELKIPGFIVYNDYWMIFGFLIGLTFMTSIFFITIKIKKDRRYVNATLSTEIISQNSEQDISTDDPEILESYHEAKLMYNSTMNNNTATSTLADLNNTDDKNRDNLENHEINTLDKSNDLKLNYSSRKTSIDIVLPILRKNSPVIPDNNNDDIIFEKFIVLQKEHCAYCSFDDFKNLLSNVQIENKILFKDKYDVPLKFTKPEYLKILNYILDGNIINHPMNSKVVQWIEKSFDNYNIDGNKIGTIDISKFKK